MLSLLILLAVPQQAAPGPASQMRYRYQSNTETVIDATEFMAAMKSSLGVDPSATAGGAAFPMPTIPPVRSVVILTVQARDSAGGRAAHIIVDSVSSDQFALLTKMLDSLPAGIADSLKDKMKDAMKTARGETLDVFAVAGKQLEVKISAPGTAQMAIVRQALQMLFPPMKVGTTVGQAWTDTVSTDTLISAGGMDMQPKSTVITEWNMLSATLFEGNVTTTNSMAMPESVGGSVEGTSTGKTRLQLDKNRWVMTAGSTTRIDSKVKMAFLGDGSMSVTQTSTVSLIRVP